MKWIIILCLIFSLNIEKLYAQNDHLEPVKSIFDEYDYHGGVGWLTEIINGNIDVGLLKKAVIEHEKGNLDACQKYVDQMQK